MKKAKQILSVLLTVVMLMCAVPVMQASATSKTVSEAMSWCDSKVGSKVGTGQCVALIQAYYEYLGASKVSGNACDYATNSLPSGWSRVKGGVPQAGDILVYTGAKYGHVCIYAGGTTAYHQNWSGLWVEKKTDWPYNKSWYSNSEGGTKSYWGYIRPDFISNYINFWAITKADNSDAGIDPNSTPTLSGQYKFWFKRVDSDSNHYVNMFVDDTQVIFHGSVDGSGYTAYVIDTANLSNGKHSIKCVYVNTLQSSTAIKEFYVSNEAYDPIGSLDTCEGGAGTVKVGGWAFDPSNSSASIDIHVYIGADSFAAGGEGHNIGPANGERNDVNNVYGISGKHGFTSIISTSKTGNQTVYVYAINIGAGATRLIDSKTVNITPHKHSYSGKVTTAATCTTDGVKTYTCSCGASYTEKINKLGHSYGAWTKLNDTQHQRVCSRNSSHVEKANHTWNAGSVTKAATCSATGVKTYTCTVCSATKTETISINASNHINIKNVAAVASTCTVKGYTAGVYCNDCKKYISGHAEQPLAAHTTTLINAKDATYDAEGYTGDTYCTACKQTLAKGDVIPKLTKPDDPTNPTNPTQPQPTQPQQQPSGSCKYCGGTHTGFPGILIGFFHSILALFGLRK